MWIIYLTNNKFLVDYLILVLFGFFLLVKFLCSPEKDSVQLHIKYSC